MQGTNTEDKMLLDPLDDGTLPDLFGVREYADQHCFDSSEGASRKPMTTSLRPALEVALHQHRCRHCAVHFDCALPNRDCPTLCPRCAAVDTAREAAFWRWWEGEGGRQFTKSDLAALTSSHGPKAVNRASMAFAAGFRAARERKETTDGD